jgi:penicillin-binding protein 2
MIRPSPDASLPAKAVFLKVLVWGVFILFGLRLFYLQVLQGDYYRSLSENNYTRNIVLRSPRGMLLDRNGKVLCRNRVSFSLVMDSAKGGSVEDTIAAMRSILGFEITRAEVTAAFHRSPVGSLAVLARDVPPSWLQKIEAHQQELKMLRIEMELRREYPYGNRAGHALGYVGLMSPEDAKRLELKENDPFIEVGKAGVEKTANLRLMGKNGLRTAQVNSSGREVLDPKLRLPSVGLQEEPVPGKPLNLNLDIELQTILEQAFAGETGSAVFMNPNTGEILAWVSVPDYDPNLFSKSVSVEDWNALVNDPGHPLLNRPIQGAYPAGSTFKPFVALVGLEEGILTASTVFSCGGVWEYGGHAFHCHSKGHGAVDMLSAIQNSCNIYFYHAGDRIGIQRLDRWGALFGLGQKTGVDLPGETSGLLGSPEWKKAHGMGPWYPGETLPVSIGQGYLTVTPLQLLSFYGTLATGGTRYRPRIASGPPELLSTVALSPESLGVIKEGLWRVVNGGGTGKACRIPGVDVCAKTGTAQVVEASSGKNTYTLEKGERDHAWFAGFAPRNNPTVAFVVMVEHGGHGGDVGAAIARAGLEYLFLGNNPTEVQGPPLPHAPVQAAPSPQVPTDLPLEPPVPEEQPVPEGIPATVPAEPGSPTGLAP